MYILYIMVAKKQYIITKKIAKHGRQAIVVIPAFLVNELKPGTIAKFTIDVLGEENDN
jgi:hypothetical protein